MKKKLSQIHPELQQIAQRTPAITFNRQTLWFVRLMMRLTRTPAAPADIRIENKSIPGPDGRTPIRLRLYRPLASTEQTPVLVWLHGGGYVMGTPEMDDLRCADYVRQAGVVVVSVDYRYAPRHPFPAGLEDSYAALKWAHAQSPAARIAVGGGSAGGGLAAALAQLAHDRQEVKPALQLLVYPMLDDRTVMRKDMEDDGRLVWNQKSNRFGWESYLGQKCGAEDAPAYAVPARRTGLAGLPPAWIGVGTEDLFYDEDVAYAQRLQADGVPCETSFVKGAFHGFDVFDPHLPVVQEFRNGQIAALKKWLGE